MCWSFYGNHPKKRMARTNVVVYKILYYNMTSPFIGFEYHYDIPYRRKLELRYYITCTGRKHWFIQEGLHSFKKFETAKEYQENLSYRTHDDRFFIYTCIIPKGSEYYVNYYGEVVSSGLIVKDSAPDNRYKRLLQKIKLTFRNKNYVLDKQY